MKNIGPASSSFYINDSYVALPATENHNSEELVENYAFAKQKSQFGDTSMFFNHSIIYHDKMVWREFDDT